MTPRFSRVVLASSFLPTLFPRKSASGLASVVQLNRAIPVAREERDRDSGAKSHGPEGAFFIDERFFG